MQDSMDIFKAFDEEIQQNNEQKVLDESNLEDGVDKYAPLASRLRPTSLDEYIGQSHLIGPDKPLYKALAKKQCFSLILWGPPGVGKTTLALIIAKSVNATLETLSAVTSGIKDIREAIERARVRQSMGKRTILFVDEVHRFNKTQQDAFLPHIENGTITFIGATTENPSFELNKALLSRARVYVLKKLEDRDLFKLIDLALSSKKGLLKENIVLEEGVASILVNLSQGDARHLLNILEMASELAFTKEDGQKIVTKSMIGAVAGRRLIDYDKGGDAYYDLISAFHKSVRGSDPNAALYWYARIIAAGGDPLYVARRLLAIATEDVGLCDVRAMQVALNAYDIYKRVGDAEGQRAIAEAAVYLAMAPKSNALYVAFNTALEDAQKLPSYEVPLYLRNAPTKLMEDLGYKQGYRYAHDYDGGYAAGECFMPKELVDHCYYTPSNRGYEEKIRQKMEYLHHLDRISNEKRYDDATKIKAKEELARVYENLKHLS